MVVLSRTFFSQASCHSVVLQPHGCVATVMVWALPRSLATTRGIINLFSLPAGTKMFQFPALALRYCVVTVLQTDGLSHSEILGSKIICIYPRLIAAYHVLHRLREPRHPPCALFYFLRIFIADCSATKTVAHTFSCCYFFNLQFCLYQYVKDRCKVKSEERRVKNPCDFSLFVFPFSFTKWRISGSNR